MSMIKRNQRGFSLVEGLVATGILGAVALGMVALNSQHKAGTSGIKSSEDMSKTLRGLRTVVTNPVACRLNFKGQKINAGTLIQLVDANNNPVLRVNDLVANKTYRLSGINVRDYDPGRSVTQVEFLFTNVTDNIRSQSVKKTFEVLTTVAGGEITDCIDPVGQTVKGALYKSCMDVDPKSDGDCENNYSNLLEEVKLLYCQGHPYLEYDPGTKKCKPLDAGRVCPPGKVMAGYNPTGSQLNCTDLPNNIPPTPDNPSALTSLCTTWSGWSPQQNDVCSGEAFTQSRTCNDGTVESKNLVGTKDCSSCPADTTYCENKAAGGASNQNFQWGYLTYGPPPACVPTKKFVGGKVINLADPSAIADCPAPFSVDDVAPEFCTAWGSWTPALEDTCIGEPVKQTRKCIAGASTQESRTEDGTKECEKGCKYKHPVGWDNGTYPVVQCVEYYTPAASPVTTEETIPEGATRYITPKWCPGGGMCHGHIRVKCVNGSVQILSKSCKPGAEP